MYPSTFTFIRKCFSLALEGMFRSRLVHHVSSWSPPPHMMSIYNQSRRHDSGSTCCTISKALALCRHHVDARQMIDPECSTDRSRTSSAQPRHYCQSTIQSLPCFRSSSDVWPLSEGGKTSNPASHFHTTDRLQRRKSKPEARKSRNVFTNVNPSWFPSSTTSSYRFSPPPSTPESPPNHREAFNPRHFRTVVYNLWSTCASRRPRTA